MTEPSLFWADAAELSVLLQRAGVSSRAGAPAPRRPVAMPGERPVRAREQEIPSFPIPGGSFEERLKALLEWVGDVATSEHTFVVDEEGLALVQESAPLELIAASAAMGERWESLRTRFDLAADNSLAIGLATRERLHLLTASSRWGLLSVVISSPTRPARSCSSPTRWTGRPGRSSPRTSTSVSSKQACGGKSRRPGAAREATSCAKSW